MSRPQYYTSTKEIRTRPASNEVYWVNYNYQMVMATIKDDTHLTLLSNSSKFRGNLDWRKLEGREGWIIKDVECKDVTFFDFKYKNK